MDISLLHYMFHVNKRRHHFLREKLKSYHFSGSMYLVLTHIYENRNSSQEEISNSHDIDKATVAREAKKLEDMGLIEREESPENRRQYILKVTKAGKKIAEDIKKMDQYVIAVITADFTQEERDLLCSLLSRLEQNSERLE